MCGIAGVFGRNDLPTVDAMLAELHHRGPDDRHSVAANGATLGAVRLSIVDLAGGRQPLPNEDKSVWAAQNGELYNFPELRPQLLASGHQLKTRCDTEVLPHLWEDYGKNLVQHIDGMFAVSIWDARKQTGLLARDRMGKKPLYYVLQGDALYYASEIKALLRIPGFERRLNPEAVHHYLGYKHVPHPLTIFDGLAMLPPAHALVFQKRQDGSRPTIQVSRYWNVDFCEDPETARMSEDDVAERLLELLDRGVQKRLMADVPIGFFLSGGLDSSLSTVLAARSASNRIKTFTLCYGDDSTTEGKQQDTRWARYIANEYQTDHHEERIELTSFPDELPDILRSFDEPFSGVVSTYFLSRLIARHVKVAISGDGADELFGSYLSHRLALPMANYERYLQTGDVNQIRLFEDQPGFLARIHSTRDWEWRSRLLVFNEEEKAALYSPEFRSLTTECNTAFDLRRTYESLRSTHPTSRVLDAEFRSFFPDQVLTFTDRLSMAHSLEVRTAFLDTAFVEFAAGLPGSLRIKDGVTKYILKKAAMKLLPEEMVGRPKEGFVMPVNGWLLNGLQDYVRDTLSASEIDRYGIFQPAAVQSLMDDFYRGGGGSANKLLSLVCFQEWLNIYRPAVGMTAGRAA